MGQAFMDFAKPIFETHKGWTYRPHDRHLSFAPDMRHAYFDELLDNDKLGLCRGTGVLELVGGDWKIMQYSLSVPIPNEAAAEVVKAIKEKAAPHPEKHKE
jgi:hypothetical protein